ELPCETVCHAHGSAALSAHLSGLGPGRPGKLESLVEAHRGGNPRKDRPQPPPGPTAGIRIRRQAADPSCTRAIGGVGCRVSWAATGRLHGMLRGCMTIRSRRSVAWLLAFALGALPAGCNQLVLYPQTAQQPSEPAPGLPSKHSFPVSQFVFISDFEIQRT